MTQRRESKGLVPKIDSRSIWEMCFVRNLFQMISPAHLRSCFLLCFASSCLAYSPGDTDLGYGPSANGRSVLPGAGFPLQLEVQADGKAVVLTTASSGTQLHRLTEDGDPDPTFEPGPLVEFEEGTRFALQPDGKIVLVGTLTTSAFGECFFVQRYDASGVLDPAFNGGGQVVTSFGTRRDRAKDVLILPDGKILVVGSANGTGIARYNIDGSLDSSFNGTGTLTLSSGIGGFNLALQSDGKILTGGSGIARLFANGKLDRSFRRNVISAEEVLLQHDGRVLAFNSVQLDGFRSNGAPDRGFTSFNYFSAGGRDIALQGDGKILVLTGVFDGYLSRRSADGSVDTTFSGGEIRLPRNLSSDLRLTCSTLATCPDRKILVAGVATSLDDVEVHDLVLIRLLNDPQFEVTTLAATNVGATSVVLHGSVITHGETNGTAVFEYGPSPSQLNMTSAPVAIAAGPDSTPVQVTLTGLTEGTIYYYQLRASHQVPFAPQRGEVLNFATITYQPPIVLSRPATALTANGATLRASVTPNGVAAQVRFQWGTSANYENVTSDINLAPGTAAEEVTETLTGLTDGQTYHFRAVAVSEAGTTLGPDRTFIPSASAPQPQDDVVLVDGTVNLAVLANDGDPNSSALTLISVDSEGPPQHGTAQVVGNIIAYTPSAGMLTDTFSYLVQNATGQTAKATVRAYRLSEIRGSFYGVLSGNGQLNLGMGPTGAFSMRLTWQGEEYAAMARLNSSGSVIVPLDGKGSQQGRTLTLTIQFDPTTEAVLVHLMDSVLGGPFEIVVPRSGEADDEVDAVRGTLYTTTIDVPEESTLAESPEAANPFANKFRGSGFASVKIAKNRSARFVGQMPDTAKFSAGSNVARRTYAFYSALYRIKRGALGSVSGQAALQSNFELRSTSLNWQRQADNRDSIFSGAFNTPAFLTGDRYTPPKGGQLLQIGLELLSGAFSNANANMSLGGLAPEFSQRLKFIPGSVHVVGENPSKVKLRISPRTGTFSGSFLHNTSQTMTKYSGIFITSAFQIREGRGSFRGVNAGGKVRIAKP